MTCSKMFIHDHVVLISKIVFSSLPWESVAIAIAKPVFLYHQSLHGTSCPFHKSMQAEDKSKWNKILYHGVAQPSLLSRKVCKESAYIGEWLVAESFDSHRYWDIILQMVENVSHDRGCRIGLTAEAKSFKSSEMIHRTRNSRPFLGYSKSHLELCWLGIEVLAKAAWEEQKSISNLCWTQKYSGARPFLIKQVLWMRTSCMHEVKPELNCQCSGQESTSRPTPFSIDQVTYICFCICVKTHFWHLTSWYWVQLAPMLDQQEVQVSPAQPWLPTAWNASSANSSTTADQKGKWQAWKVPVGRKSSLLTKEEGTARFSKKPCLNIPWTNYRTRFHQKLGTYSCVSALASILTKADKWWC